MNWPKGWLKSSASKRHQRNNEKMVVVVGNQTIYLAGDSTMADYPPESYPMQGWGNKLPLFIPDSVRVVNKAVCGRSSKSFVEEGRLEEILQMIKPGDYLFIQFGHNDSGEAYKSLEHVPSVFAEIYRRRESEGGLSRPHLASLPETF
jgi:lysophospholipase L1-like esterase